MIEMMPIAAMAFPGALRLLLELMFVCAAGALLWWGFSKISLPEPVKTILMVVVGLILLFVLWQLVMGGGF